MGGLAGGIPRVCPRTRSPPPSRAARRIYGFPFAVGQWRWQAGKARCTSARHGDVRPSGHRRARLLRLPPPALAHLAERIGRAPPHNRADVARRLHHLVNVAKKLLLRRHLLRQLRAFIQNSAHHACGQARISPTYRRHLRCNAGFHPKRQQFQLHLLHPAVTEMQRGIPHHIGLKAYAIGWFRARWTGNAGNSFRALRRAPRCIHAHKRVP